MTTFREYREGDMTPPDDVALRSMPREARAIQGERAVFVSRLIAAGLDVTLIFLAVMATNAAIWMASFLFDPVSSTPAFGSGDRVPDIGWLII